MIKTEYGIFDGNKWESVSQICFKHNFREESYQEVKATPGDYGIEGFTRKGKAFQCYCPDEHYAPSDLYEKQRDKISKDLKKLKRFEVQLKKFLGNTKIDKWYFVTPICAKNDIISHCTTKRDEVRSWGLSIIDNDNFEVIFEDISFLQPYIKIATGAISLKVNIGVNQNLEDSEIIKWKADENSLIETAKIKHRKRLPENSNKIDLTIDKLTEKSVSDFLDGDIILRQWQDEYPEDYEKFLAIISLVESEVEDKCLIPSDNNDKLYWSFKTLLEQKLKEAFQNIEIEMILKLTNRVMADWIFRCPINFD
jgi:hypothetical protein